MALLARGLKIKTPDGYFQIDGESKNYKVLQRGFGTTDYLSMGDYKNTNNKITFPIQPAVPLVFVRFPYGFWAHIGHLPDMYNDFTEDQSVTRWVTVNRDGFLIRSATDIFNFTRRPPFINGDPGSPNAVFEYVVLVPVTGVPDQVGEYGLRVKTQDGLSVVFDNRNRYFCIDAVAMIDARRPYFASGNLYQVVNITLPLNTPPLGKRFILLNSLQQYDNWDVGSIDGEYFICSPCDVGVAGAIHSETSVQFRDCRTFSQISSARGNRPNFLTFMTGYIADE